MSGGVGKEAGGLRPALHIELVTDAIVADSTAGEDVGARRHMERPSH